MTPWSEIIKITGLQSEKKKKTKKGEAKTKVTKKKQKKKNPLRIRCPICFNNLGNESVSTTVCGHVFCTTCLQKAVRLKPACPTCRRTLRGNKAHHLLYLDDNICDLD